MSAPAPCPASSRSSPTRSWQDGLTQVASTEKHTQEYLAAAKMRAGAGSFRPKPRGRWEQGPAGSTATLRSPALCPALSPSPSPSPRFSKKPPKTSWQGRAGRGKGHRATRSGGRSGGQEVTVVPGCVGCCCRSLCSPVFAHRRRKTSKKPQKTSWQGRAGRGGGHCATRSGGRGGGKEVTAVPGCVGCCCLALRLSSDLSPPPLDSTSKSC